MYKWNWRYTGFNSPYSVVFGRILNLWLNFIGTFYPSTLNYQFYIYLKKQYKGSFKERLTACGIFKLIYYRPVSMYPDLAFVICTSEHQMTTLSLFFFSLRWWRYERGLNSMAWKILPCELNYAITKRVHSSLVEHIIICYM